MPVTDVFFYREKNGKVPVLDFLADLRRNDRRAYAKCVARVRRLAQVGYELKRPDADYLREGIYELRVRIGRLNYRILYFFHGRNVALLSNGLRKERTVPETEIERALERKRCYERDPEAHTYEEETGDG